MIVTGIFKVLTNSPRSSRTLSKLRKHAWKLIPRLMQLRYSNILVCNIKSAVSATVFRLMINVCGFFYMYIAQSLKKHNWFLLNVQVSFPSYLKYSPYTSFKFVTQKIVYHGRVWPSLFQCEYIAMFSCCILFLFQLLIDLDPNTTLIEFSLCQYSNSNFEMFPAKI